MSIVNKKKAPESVPTPPAGYKTLFFRSDTGVPAVKDESGVVSDLVIPGDASGVTYTPQDAHNWTDSVDPGNVDDALNDLAVRVNTLEEAEAPDAQIVTYTPTTAADWDGDVDPGDAQEAFDQLAERVTDLEEAGGAGNAFGIIAVAGQSNVEADSAGDTLTLAGAGLAVITTDAASDTVTITVAVPDASAVPFTPSNSMNWTDSEDPGDVDDALNDLAARLQAVEELTGSSGEEMMSGYIGTPSAKDYKVVVRAAHGGIIQETTTIAESGTGTVTFKINTNALGGTANSASSSEQTRAHSSSNVFAQGDDIVVTPSSLSSLVGLSFTIRYFRTAT